MQLRTTSRRTSSRSRISNTQERTDKTGSTDHVAETPESHHNLTAKDTGLSQERTEGGGRSFSGFPSAPLGLPGPPPLPWLDSPRMWPRLLPPLWPGRNGPVLSERSVVMPRPSRGNNNAALSERATVMPQPPPQGAAKSAGTGTSVRAASSVPVNSATGTGGHTAGPPPRTR